MVADVFLNFDILELTGVVSVVLFLLGFYYFLRYIFRKFRKRKENRIIKKLEDQNENLKSEALEFFSNQADQIGLNISGPKKGNILDYINFRNQIGNSLSQMGESLLCVLLYCFLGDQVLSVKEKSHIEDYFLPKKWYEKHSFKDRKKVNIWFDGNYIYNLARDLGLRSGKNNGPSKVMDEIYFMFMSFDFESPQGDLPSALKDIFSRLDSSTRKRTIKIIKSLTPKNQRNDIESTFIRLLGES
jgi:hypothetical protein